MTSVDIVDGNLMGATRTRNGSGKLFAAFAMLGLVFVAQIVGAMVGAFVGDEMGMIYTWAGGIAAALAIVALGGASYLRIDRDAIFEAWKIAWWVVFVSAVLMVWDLTSYIEAGEMVHAGWFMRCVESLVLCLGIGLSEEAVYRGLFLGGLLSRMGDRKDGVWWAVGIAALAFGMAHVTIDDFDASNLLTFVQGGLKILQTGMYAVVLCAVMLKTKNLVGAMLVHALDDWLLFVVSTGLYGASFEVEYVSQDQTEAVFAIGLYVVVCLLYLPTVIKAIKVIDKLPAPQFGPFYQEEPTVAMDGAEAAYGQLPMAEGMHMGAGDVWQGVPETSVQQPYAQWQPAGQSPQGLPAPQMPTYQQPHDGPYYQQSQEAAPQQAWQAQQQQAWQAQQQQQAWQPQQQQAWQPQQQQAWQPQQQQAWQTQQQGWRLQPQPPRNTGRPPRPDGL